MPFAIAYDMTRIATRVLNRTPNGIDRVDMAYAKHFLSHGGPDQIAMMITVLVGVRAYDYRAARDVIDGIAAHWGEESDPSSDVGYQRVRDWLVNGPGANPTSATRLSFGRPERRRGVVRWIAQHGVPFGRSPVTALPKGARYLNVSQFPIWLPSYLKWAQQRPDIKPVFYIHDLLPLESGEYFREKEYERHRMRLVNVARFGAGAIVSTEIVKNGLLQRFAELGRTDMPILVAPMPTAPVFRTSAAPEEDVLAHPYFVMCGTLEPRKNHVMILHIWRDLVLRFGDAAPKLILIGVRGWENENIVDLLERCRPLRRHVLEVSGLSTPAYARLLKGARALLTPSFAEGYGLPLAEALAAGAPVIASDIPVFHEIGGANFVALDPIDGEGWRAAIIAHADSQTTASTAARDTPDIGDYFAKVDAFLQSL
jgi:hypothetical protein